MDISILENTSDVISRRAAIDALDAKITVTGRENAEAVRRYVTLIVDRIVNLPSAQPEPCEDAVSREVLKDGFTEMCNLICPYTKKQQHVMCGSCLMGTAFDVLEATPSVTPKQRTGKWIDVDDHYNRISGRCSVCGWEALLYETDVVGMDFCPNCGADMREVTT